MTRTLPSRSFTTSSFLLASASESPAAESLNVPSKQRWRWFTGIALIACGVTVADIGNLRTGDWSGWLGGTPISQLYTFEQYEIVKRKRLSSTTTLLTIQPTTFGPRAYKSRLDSRKIAEASENGIWSVQVKHPLLTIARLYTPIPPSLTESSRPAWTDKSGQVPEDPEEDQLRFLVRSNPEGELSKYLSRLQPGAHVELRGPYQEYELPDNVSQIVFLAGGTGIAPALQMAYSVLEKKSNTSKTNINILWANRHAKDCQGGPIEPPPPPVLERAWSSVFRADIADPRDHGSWSQDQSPIVEELGALKRKHPGNLHVSYFADDQQRFITRQDVQRKLKSHTNLQSNGALSDDPGKKLILISGPDGFVEYFAGPKMWKEGKELQGDLGGILKKINPPGWTIWKL